MVEGKDENLSKRYGILRSLLCFIAKDNRYFVVVPTNCRQNIVKAVHGPEHRSINQMLSLIKDVYYWPRARQYVSDFVRTCESCRICKYQPAASGRVSQSVPTTEAISCVNWALDITGPFETGRFNNNRFIIVLVCKYTRWIEAFAARNHKAATIASLIFYIIQPRFGSPRSISSDNAQELVGEVMAELTNMLGTK